MNELLEFSKKAALSLFQDIKSGSRSIAAEQLNQASKKLDTLAEALKEAVEKLRESQINSLADMTEAGSESVTRLADNLRASSPERIISEVEDFARDRPGVFLGIAVVAGLLLGQLFSSPGGGDDITNEFQSRKESSIEYRPGKDEEEYYERH